MTAAQITYILGKHGLSANTWLDDLDKYYPLICLDQDSNVFVNCKDRRYFFNSSNNVLEIVRGRTLSDGSFISDAGEADDFEPTEFISYSLIYGFISSTYTTEYDAYPYI